MGVVRPTGGTIVSACDRRVDLPRVSARAGRIVKLPRRGQFVSDSLSDPPRLSAEVAGGASSTMGRRYGWAADHVSAFDVVTADGRLRRVSARSDADLFSAMLGGRSNFGVVTAMEFALFPVTRLYAGALFYSGEHTRNVLNAYRRLTATAPEDVSTGLALFNLPPLQDVPPFMRGRLAVSLRVSYVGDAGAGERLIEPLRRAAPVLMDTVADIPYAQFASISGDPTDPAVAVEHFGLLRELTEDAVDAIVEVAGPEADTSTSSTSATSRGLSVGRRRSPTPSVRVTRPSRSSL